LLLLSHIGVRYPQRCTSFEPDVVLCFVSVIPFQHRSCSVCESFVRLGHNNG